jgi:hypothetical protein
MSPTTSRIHVVSEGVLASYIHDISSHAARQRREPVLRSEPAKPPPAPSGDRALAAD